MTTMAAADHGWCRKVPTTAGLIPVQPDIARDSGHKRAIPRLVVRSDSELTKRYVGMLAEPSDANECRDVWEFCDNRFRDKRWKIAESRFDLEPVDSAPLMDEERAEARTRGWRVSCDAIEARFDIRLLP